MRRSVIGLWVSLFPLAALAQEQEMKSIVDFTQPDAVRWNIVNDGVMGGLSSSDLELTDSETALFSGGDECRDIKGQLF
ncbi:MAG: CIA30 family protein [Longimicrobiales bacterium]|nr:CIA30 family protein [Longimicrobiales bacterium]